ncbi:MAG: hypothetical protein ACXV3D_05005 [Halobacteriota archaeon]
MLKPQGREATNAVVQGAKGGDVVLMYPFWHEMVFNYYNTRTDLVVSQLPNTDPATVSTAAALAIAGHDRVWFSCNHVGPDAYYKNTDQVILSTRNGSYTLSYSKHYCGYDVYLFEKRA